MIISASYEARQLAILLQPHCFIPLATGWTTEGSEFLFRFGQEFPLLHNVQTGSGAHPASYPMDTGDSSLGGKAAGA
jgi:hypothetical protein